MWPLALFYFFKIILILLFLLPFHVNFRSAVDIYKNNSGIIIGIVTGEIGPWWSSTDHCGGHMSDAS